MLSIQCMELVEDGMILGIWDINRIYRYEDGNCKVSSILDMELVNRQIMSPYGKICKYAKGKYLFAPLGETKILLYSSLNHDYRTIELKESLFFAHKENNTFFLEIVPVLKYLLLIPCGYDAIIRFDCETEQIEYFYDCVETIIHNTSGSNTKMFYRGYAIANGMVYLTSFSCKGMVLRINPENMSFETIELEKDTISICGSEEGCWLLTKEGEFLQWDIANNVISVLKKYNYDSSILGYQEIIDNQSWVVLLPWESNQIIVYDKEMKIEKKLQIEEGKYLMSMFGKILGNVLYVFFHEIRQLYLIDLDEMCVKKTIEIEASEEDEIEYWEGIYGYEKSLYREINNKSLEQFIGNI